MKQIGLLFISFFIVTSTWAANECASKMSEIANIADVMNHIDPWGVWEGSADGKSAVIDLKVAGGKFMGTADIDGRKIGPLNVKVCDYGTGIYTLVILGYEAQFEVLSPKKIKIYFKVGNSDSVILTKNKAKSKPKPK
jgi:hypothetical protein